MFVYIPHRACEYDLTLLAFYFHHPLRQPLSPYQVSHCVLSGADLASAQQFAWAKIALVQLQPVSGQVVGLRVLVGRREQPCSVFPLMRLLAGVTP